MPLPRLSGPVIAFSRFWFAREAGLLISDGNAIELAARPCAVLGALLAARGQVVSTAELREFVWNGTSVDANTVQAQISAIRRALGDERDLIVTVPGRGYRIACDIRIVDTPNAGLPRSFPPAPLPLSPAAGIRRPARIHRLPSGYDTDGATARAKARPSQALFDDETKYKNLSPSPFIGRHAELSELLAIVPVRRIVTLTGAPGIGKTRLAIEAATRLASQFPDGTIYADLASLSQPDRIVHAIAAAAGLGAAVRAASPATLIASLCDLRMLVVVDHCDHLSEAAGRALDALIGNTRGLHLIVTCGTRLFVPGELPVEVAPLRVSPGTDGEMAAPIGDDAQHLLWTRLAQALAAAGHAASVAAPLAGDCAALHLATRICRRVAGLPLALELAAASIAQRIAAGAGTQAALLACADMLDTHIVRRTGARRVTLPRALIAQAAIEACGAILGDDARIVLRRLAIFTGTFPVDAALDVLGTFEVHDTVDDATRRDKHGQCLQTLAAAGYIHPVKHAETGLTGLRMQPAVRRYALAELDRHGESVEAAAHHARYVAKAVSRCEQADSGHDIDELRAALEWSIETDKIDLSADLLEHSAQHWMALSLLDEYIDWIHAALEKTTAAAVRCIRDEMRLRASLASALTLHLGAPREIVSNWERAYTLATICADTMQRQRALFCLIMLALDAGNLVRCAQLCTSFEEIAVNEHLPAAIVTARRIRGILHAYHGEFALAIQLLAPVSVTVSAARDTSAQGYDVDALLEADAMTTTFGVSLHLVAAAILAAAGWFTNTAQPASRLHDLLCGPSDDGTPLSYCIALELACALAVLNRDAARVESYANSLLARARASALHRWLRAGFNAQLWLEAHQGDDDAALRLLAGAAKRIGRGRVCLLDLALVATLLPSLQLPRDTELAAALSSAIRMAVKQGQARTELWHVPELQRIDALLRLAAGEEIQPVRLLLEQALERARNSGAKRSELQIAAELSSLGASRELRVHRAPFAPCR